MSAREAEVRLREEGHNELPSRRQRHVLAIALGVLREPMFVLLVGAGAVYLLLGDLQEALLLLGSISFIVGITFYQERKTERSLEALRDLSSPRAIVIRDGERLRIPGRDLVRGDLVVLGEGDRVPADGGLVTSHDLSVDESLLTGESVPVRKAVRSGAGRTGRPGGDDLPFVYSGTLVVQGQGIASVQATGEATEIGRIGRVLDKVGTEQTLLQVEANRLARAFGIVGLAVCIVVAVVYGSTRLDWLSGILVGITLAMSLLPEEIPVILTVFLALGAWRISQRRVLTRRTPAIEALGSATVLCVDKTGTLTENRMSVRRLLAHGQIYEVPADGRPALPPQFRDLARFSILASETEALDPLERALTEMGRMAEDGTSWPSGDWTLVHEYALSPTLLAMSHVWRQPEGEGYLVAAKGAPEAIARLCRLAADEVTDLLSQVGGMATDGLRVIAVAQARFADAPWPASQDAFDFELLGLVGLADPLRSGVPAALAECRTAGIRVVMVTGDYPETARAIAAQAGLAPLHPVITGTEMEQMGDRDLRERARTTAIFARVVPQQKLRLVEALEASGEIVAMTGDGVNDAPALKAAHIGIAMGSRGTDVAREAASLVLLDDDFASIVQAVKLGRRIFDNLKKAMAFIFAIHVPIAGIALVPVLAHWPLVLMPVHIVFLELIIDPACSIVFEAEPEEPDVMRRPPRNASQPLFDRSLIGLSVLQGAGVLAVILGVFGIALGRGMEEPEARALAFATLVVANLSLIHTNRSWTRPIFGTLRSASAPLWWVTGGALLFLGVVLYAPFFRDLFRFAPLDGLGVFTTIAAGITSVIWFEALKATRVFRQETPAAYGRSGTTDRGSPQ